MSDIFGKASDYAGGSFFKPGDAMSDIALLIEPHKIDKNVSSTYQGTTRLRDEVTCDITVFATTESVGLKQPTAIHKGIKVVHGMLTSTLERNMGKPFLGVVRKIPTKGGSGYVFRDVEDNAHVGLVSEYYVEREAEVKANLADAPSFA